MISFNISIAGQVVRIEAFYEKLREYCRDYLCDGEPTITVTSDREGIEYERTKSVLEDQRIGRPVQQFPDAYLETLSIYRKIVQALLDHDTLLLHGSAVAVDGEAFLFSATSGTGKSTHTAFWRELFGDRAVMVNDDKPLIRVTEEGAFVCGTPWDGKHQLSTNIILPLKAFCILERGTENHIQAISPAQALPMLIQQSSHPKGAAAMDRYLQIMDRLSRAISFYHLSCTPTAEAAAVAYEGMTGRKP